MTVDEDGLTNIRSLEWMNLPQGNFISIFPNGGFKIGEYYGDSFSGTKSRFTAYYADGSTEKVGKCLLF